MELFLSLNWTCGAFYIRKTLIPFGIDAFWVDWFAIMYSVSFSLLDVIKCLGPVVCFFFFFFFYLMSYMYAM